MTSKWNTVTADFLKSLFLRYISGDPDLNNQSFEILIPEFSKENSHARLFITGSLDRNEYLDYDSFTKFLVESGDLPIDSITAKYNLIALTGPLGDLKDFDLTPDPSIPDEFKGIFKNLADKLIEGIKNKVQIKFYPLLDEFVFNSAWNDLILHDRLGMWFYKDQTGKEIFSKEIIRPEETRYMKIKNYPNDEFINLVNNFLGKK